MKTATAERIDVVLLISQTATDSALVTAALPSGARIHHVQHITAACQLVEQERIGLAIVEVGCSSDLDMITQLRAHQLSIPIIVIGADDEDQREAVLKKGAQVYVPRCTLTPGLLRDSVDIAVHRHSVEGVIERLDAVCERRVDSTSDETPLQLGGLIAECEGAKLALEATLTGLDHSDHLEHTYYDLKNQLLRRGRALTKLTGRIRNALQEHRRGDEIRDRRLRDNEKEAAQSRQAVIVLQGENKELKSRLKEQEQDMQKLMQSASSAKSPRSNAEALRVAQQHYYGEVKRLQDELAEARAARTRLEEALAAGQRCETNRLLETMQNRPVIMSAAPVRPSSPPVEIDARLHEVEGVLEQVGRTAESISSFLKTSRLSNLSWAEDLVKQNSKDLTSLTTEDQQSHRIPVVLAKLASQWNQQQSLMLEEMATLSGRVERIRALIHGNESTAAII
jgi:hypothetical protein